MIDLRAVQYPHTEIVYGMERASRQSLPRMVWYEHFQGKHPIMMEEDPVRAKVLRGTIFWCAEHYTRPYGLRMQGSVHCLLRL